MPQTDNAAAALLSIFPDLEAVDRFVEDSKKPGRLDSFIQFAAAHNVISEPIETEFRRFVKENSLGLELCTPPTGLSFEEMIDNKDEWLDVDCSTRKFTETINTFLDRHQLALASISNSIISRLKNEPVNTPHKRDTLRAIAFWMGFEKFHLAPAWNYYILTKLCPNPETILSEKEGITLTLHVLGTGRERVVGWLRDEVKKSVAYLDLYQVNLKLMSSSPTTVFLNLPKIEGPAGEPTLFRAAARDSMALTHQILTRFYLSDFCGANTLIITLTAGEFQRNIDRGKMLTEAVLPEGSQVRLGSFALLCVRMAAIKAVIREKPIEARLLNGTPVTVWLLESFWNFSYCDFVPQLLDPAIIPESTRSPSFPEFRKALHFPHHSSGPEVLSTLQRSPQNTMLLLEISKTLACRMMFSEADHVLTGVLSSNPAHVVARAFRMRLLILRALTQTRLSDFETLSAQAIHEGLSFLNSYSVEESEFFCELGIAYLNAAVGRIEFSKKGASNIPRAQNRAAIVNLLTEAENSFLEGALRSPSGHDVRSTFRQMYASGIKRLVEDVPELLLENTPVRDPGRIFEAIGESFMIQMGWADDDPDQEAFFEKRFLDATDAFDATVLSRTSRPNIYFSPAALLFDFLPKLKVKHVKLVLMWLEQAREETVKLIRDQQEVGFYGVKNFFSRIVTADHFLADIDAALTVVGDIADTLVNMPDGAVVDRDLFPRNYRGIKLLLLTLEQN